MSSVNGSKRSFDEIMARQHDDQHQLQFTSYSKKVKLKEINYVKYKTGNIISISLHNIMVYTQGKFVFDSNLNMILGANGSGKSTVLCAINIVLDGSLGNIGRATEIDNFIKKDCDQGAITIALKSNYNLVSKSFNESELSMLNIKPEDEVIHITRKLFRFSQKNKKKHEYFINGVKLKNEAPVKLLVKTFNIQLDNLTQFLSQERAREFSNLNQKDLLKTTLKSISMDIYNEWNSLSEVETRKNQLQDLIKEQERKFDEAKEKKAFLDQKVQENERYATLKEEIHQYENVLILVKYNEAKKGTKKAEEEYDECMDMYQKKSLEYKKIMKTEKIYLKIKEKVNEDISKSDREAQNYMQSGGNNIQEIKQLKKKADEEISSLKHFDSIKQKYVDECKKYENAITDISSQILEFSIVDQQFYNQWKENRLKIGSSSRNLEGDIQEQTNYATSLKRRKKAVELQIQKLRNGLSGKDPLLKLPEDDQGRFRSALDLAKQKGFAEAALPPAIACLEVIDDKYADIMNCAISRNTSLAITFVTSEAKEQLGKFVSSNLGINSFFLGEETILKPPIGIAQLKELGFDGYAADFLEGNEEVRQMVITKNRLNLTPVSLRDLDQNMIEKIKRLRDKNGKLIFTQVLAGKFSYKFIKSKYDGQVTVSSFIIQSGRYYRKTNNMLQEDQKKQTEDSLAQATQSIKNIDIEIEGRERIIKDIKLKLHNLNEEGRENTDKIKKYEIQYKTYRELQMQKERYVNNLEHATKKAEEFSDSKTNDMKTKVIKNVVSFKINQSLATMQPIKHLTEGAADSLFRRQKNLLVFQALENDQLLNQGETNTLKQQCQELEKKADEIKQLLEELKNDNTRQILETKVQSFSKNELKKLKKLHRSLDPCTVSAISTLIRSKNTDLQNVHFDSASENELKGVKRTIDEIDSRLPKLKADFEEANSGFCDRDAILRRTVENTIQGISEKFEGLFKNVGCKGQVTLSDTERPYKEWEIEIQVAFRANAQMQKLSGKTHSGGEQSVSTMLYLISLQRYTKAPFTVIDEINQGMDANNERKIHEILVKETCSSVEGEGSQYILITPKLLTNLYYAQGMQFSVIFAGLEMPQVTGDEYLLNLGAATLYDI